MTSKRRVISLIFVKKEIIISQNTAFMWIFALNILWRLRLRKFPPHFIYVCVVHERCSSITKPSDLASFFFFDPFAVDLNVNLVIKRSLYPLISLNYHEFGDPNIAQQPCLSVKMAY